MDISCPFNLTRIRVKGLTTIDVPEGCTVTFKQFFLMNDKALQIKESVVTQPINISLMGLYQGLHPDLNDTQLLAMVEGIHTRYSGLHSIPAISEHIKLMRLQHHVNSHIGFLYAVKLVIVSFLCVAVLGALCYFLWINRNRCRTSPRRRRRMRVPPVPEDNTEGGEELYALGE